MLRKIPTLTEILNTVTKKIYFQIRAPSGDHRTGASGVRRHHQGHDHVVGQVILHAIDNVRRFFTLFSPFRE